MREASPLADGAPAKRTGNPVAASTVMGGTRIDLAWTTPTEIGDSAITGYRIEWSPDGTDGSWSDLVADTDSTATAYSNTGLASETTRHYRVSAINDDGAGSPSDSASATTDDIVGPVVTVAAVQVSGDRLGIVFDEALDGTSGSAPPKSAFTVTADGTGIGIGTVTVLGPSKQVLFTGLSPTIKQSQAVVVTVEPRTKPATTADALRLWDDNGNGRITCKEARRHGIAPVPRGHPAYPFMRDGDGDGVVCE